MIRLLQYFACVLLLAPSAANSNLVVDLPLEEKVHSADLVVIATASVVAPAKGIDHPAFRDVIFRPTRFLKGAKTRVLNVRMGSSVSEFDPDCCVVGASYLLFLKEETGGLYKVVNPPHGVVPIAEKQEKHRSE